MSKLLTPVTDLIAPRKTQIQRVRPTNRRPFGNTPPTPAGDNISPPSKSSAILRAHREFASPGVGLEIGCEGGRWCRLLTSLGWQMTGTDINPETLGRCQERNPSVRCILVDPSDESFPAAAESVDLLLCMECPVVEAPWFADEARRVLKPGGVLVGNLLNRSSWRGLAANLKSDLLRRPRYYSTDYSSLRTSLQQQGFAFLDEHGYGWPPFGRMSNSTWIPLAARGERRLGLHRRLTAAPGSPSSQHSTPPQAFNRNAVRLAATRRLPVGDRSGGGTHQPAFPRRSPAHFPTNKNTPATIASTCMIMGKPLKPKIQQRNRPRQNQPHPQQQHPDTARQFHRIRSSAS